MKVCRSSQLSIDNTLLLCFNLEFVRVSYHSLKKGFSMKKTSYNMFINYNKETTLTKNQMVNKQTSKLLIYIKESAFYMPVTAC